MLASLGKNPTDEHLDATMDEAPGSTNFTMFLTMFGEKLNGADPEDVIRNAFTSYFDKEATVTIQEDCLREQLVKRGSWFAEEEVQGLYRVASIDKKGGFHYIALMCISKHGPKTKTTEKNFIFQSHASFRHSEYFWDFSPEPITCP